jgi:predicted house-cleaning NTP pyrophosphatase (Maf/HAM1 superfamily)
VIGIESIQGDFYNVMGLPVSTLVQKIKELGVI